MNLTTPVIVNFDLITYPDGSKYQPPSRSLNKLDVIIVDNSTKKSCVAYIDRFPQPVPLWVGEEYDAAGDYTQAQAEAKILELLGPDIANSLKQLAMPAKK